MHAQTTNPVSGHVRLANGKRGSSWYAKYRLPDGRQVQKRLGPAWTEKTRPPSGYFTKRTAEAALQAILTDARRGTLAGLVKTGKTFRDASAEWLRHREHERAVRPSTMKEYSSVAKVLDDAWGDRRLESITTAEIERWQARLVSEGELSRRTINKYVIVMGGIYRRARRIWGVANPVEDVERLGEPRYDHLEVYSPEEVWALVRAAESEEDEAKQDAAHQDAAIYLTAAFTGLRMGELLALRWKHVDFPGSTIRVERSITHGAEGPPKSGRVRAVPLVDELAEALARLGQRERFTGDDELVFVGETGEHLDGSALRRRYKKARDKAGLRPLRFHDLRHSFGSLAVNAFQPVEVKELMGHADLRTTARYLHYRNRGDEAKRLAEAFRVEQVEESAEEPEAAA
jgi:integrase